MIYLSFAGLCLSSALADAIPEDVEGIWAARIRKDDLVIAPGGLPEEPSLWTLEFRASA